MYTLVRSVALLHTPDNGAVHVDWMWSPGPGLPDPDARVLRTFRLQTTPIDAPPSFEAVRLPDHRARYLWFEGEIGRGLGRVQRLWSGVARLLEWTDHRFDIELPGVNEIVRVEGVVDLGHDSSSQATIYRCTAHRRPADDIRPIGPLADQG
ncbi:MAG: hypothetical protein Tsb0013_22430 [Phycisphaerales bacterium]